MRGNNTWTVREVALGAALCAALLTLAVLQYRWIGQVAEAERARLERNLRFSVNRFAGDFDEELQRLGGILVAGNSGGLNGTFLNATINERLMFWRQTTSHPQLVKRVVALGAGAVPANLEPLANAIPPGVSLRRGGGRPAVFLDPEVPAIALPSLRQVSEGETEVSWLIVELDRDYMHDTWLPELVERNFGSDYRVQVLGGSEPGNVIYQSDDAEFPAEMDPDGVQNLFTLRVGRGRGGGGPPPDLPPPLEGGRPPGPQFDDGPGRGAPPPPGPDDPGRFGGRGQEPFGRDFGRASGGWQVRAVYKGGPLQEMVAGFRLRNLAVSFGMLMLTGLSVAMLMLSSRRARLLARQQMEFVAGVTHELRTPLAVITAASQNLADGVTSGEEQTRRYGTVIRDHGRRLAGMVEQVLRFAGLASGRVEIDQGQAVDMADLLDQAVADIQPELDAAGVELAREVDGALPMVSGDAALLAHCLRNLLSNAAKHGKQEGRPTPVQVRMRRSGEPGFGVDIEVADSGPGIDPADLPHIFEPFYRGRRATSDQVQGSGLGLSLVKKIAEAHGGRVDVFSRTGEGTSFVLRLPAAEEQKPLNVRLQAG